MHDIDASGVPTPCTIIDLGAVERNLQILADVQSRAGCKVLLALKGFAMWSLFPLMARYLSGTAASSPHEARLGREEFRREVHAYAPAWSDDDFRELCSLADHIVFNSFSQWRRFRPIANQVGHGVQFGLRLNPEHSEVKVELYDPCQRFSRLGIPLAEFHPNELDGITGFHFHTLCELGAEPMVRTLRVVEERFGRWFDRVRWINLGGGHHITKPDYNRELLIETILDLRRRTGLEVYLEPGEAIAVETGVLVTTVLDVIRNGMEIAILDTSATAHMPDVLEMPYRPPILGAGEPGEKPYTYRLGGLTCLSGDHVGDYSFDHPLRPGDRIVVLDQAHYTTVKNSTFNGVRLPSLATWDPATRTTRVLREFGYDEYRRRLS